MGLTYPSDAKTEPKHENIYKVLFMIPNSGCFLSRSKMQCARQTAQRFSQQIRIKHLVKMDSDRDMLPCEGLMDPWGPKVVRTWRTWGQRASYGLEDQETASRI